MPPRRWHDVDVDTARARAWAAIAAARLKHQEPSPPPPADPAERAANLRRRADLRIIGGGE